MTDAAKPNLRGKRTLTDSEARWYAVVFIDMAVQNFLNDGAVSINAEDDGWSEADLLVIEKHMRDRTNGLLRRQRKAV